MKILTEDVDKAACSCTGSAEAGTCGVWPFRGHARRNHRRCER